MLGKRMILSASGKKILDNFTEYLSMTRPQVIRLAFAKGFGAESNFVSNVSASEKGWEIPDIFNENDLLLFKHLLINKLKKDLDPTELSQEILKCIEAGLIIFENLYTNRNSLDDLRILIVS